VKTNLKTPSLGSGPLILGLVVLLAAGLIVIVNTAGSDVTARKPDGDRALLCGHWNLRADECDGVASDPPAEDSRVPLTRHQFRCFDRLIALRLRAVSLGDVGIDCQVRNDRGLVVL